VLHLLRSYTCRKEQVAPVTILKAACASIASHDHFSPVVVREGYDKLELRSGIIGYPNPTLELLREATREFGEDCWAATVISIGSKSIPLSKNSTNAQRLEGILKDTDIVHRELFHRLHQVNIYFRFDIPHRKRTSSNPQSAYGEIQSYKRDGRIDELIDAAVRSIHVRQQVKVLSELSE
jgi:hypothetical protein